MRHSSRTVTKAPQKTIKGIKMGIGFVVAVIFFLSLAITLKEYKESIWQPPLALTVAVLGQNQAAVISFDPTQDEGVGLLIPGNVMVPVVGNSGEYKVSSLWRYGQLQGAPLDVVGNSLSLLLGLKIDRTIYAPFWVEGNIDPSWSWMNLMKNGGATNLSEYDRFKLIQAWTKLRADQKKWLDLPLSARETQTLPDGTNVQNVDTQVLQVMIKNQFRTGNILADRRTVSVVNNSGIPGAARVFEKFLSDSGGVVVEVGGDSQSISNGWCRFNTNDPSTGGVVLWLTKRLNCVKDTQITLSGRADIQVVLDQGWGKQFNRG